MSIFSKAFWVSAGERAISTVAQTAIATIGVGAIGFEDVNWGVVASVSAVAGILSLLKSLVAAYATNGTSVSATDSETIK